VSAGNQEHKRHDERRNNEVVCKPSREIGKGKIKTKEKKNRICASKKEARKKRRKKRRRNGNNFLPPHRQ
jgi:hypothetical protein